MVTPRRDNRLGFTLVEAMITAAILGVLAMVGPSVLTQVNRFFIQSSGRSDMEKESRAVMYVINRNLHEGQSNTIIIDRYGANQPFSSRITFTKIQGTTMSFYQNGKNLIQLASGNSKILSKNVRYLAFSFPRTDDMTIVSVAVTLEKTIYSGQTTALHVASERVRVMN